MTELLPTHVTHILPLSFNSLEELYSRYGRQAFGLALRILGEKNAAEQATQEIFLRYWRQPDLYNPQNGSLLNWLLREVHCHCLDRLPVNIHPLKNGLPAEGPLSTIIIVKDQTEVSGVPSQQFLARQALSGLPPEQREILELAYFKGLNFLQIAELTGQPVQMVRQQLTVGLVRLKRGMAQFTPVKPEPSQVVVTS